MQTFKPSKKTQNATVAMFFVLCILITAGIAGARLTEDVIINALYVVAAIGGVAVGGQAKVDWEEHRAKTKNGHGTEAPKVEGQ